MQLRANMLFPSVQTHLLSFFSFWLCCEACGILVPQSGIEPMPLAMEAQSPNHWTARELPVVCLPKCSSAELDMVGNREMG